MAAVDSTKPRKPHKDFPLFPHQNGQWAKKVLGKLYYYGKWDDPQAALDKWLADKDARLNGRVPRDRDGSLTLKELCERLMKAKLDLVESGELSKRSFNDLFTECKRLLDFFGKDRFADDFEPEDFEAFRNHLSKGRKKKTLDNLVNRQRSIFNWAYKNHLLEHPAKFGESFNRVKQASLTIERNQGGEKIFEPHEIQSLLDVADYGQAAQILLGIGNGLGNADLGRLNFDHLDLKRGWLTYPRLKTGVKRKSKLWDETIEAVERWLEVRPESDSNKSLVFLTKFGNPISYGDKPQSQLAAEFRRLLTSVGLYKTRVGFYWLRHTCETIAGESRDQPAVDMLMGHKDPSMAANYRHRISDARLEDVAAVIHGWLFDEKG